MQYAYYFAVAEAPPYTREGTRDPVLPLNQRRNSLGTRDDAWKQPGREQGSGKKNQV